MRFNLRVQFRPIPEEGRGRSTPPRGTRSAITPGRGVHGYFVDSVSSAEECGLSACRFREPGIPFRGDGFWWSELEDDPDCTVCASQWAASPAATRTRSGGAARAVSSVGRLGCTRTDGLGSRGVSGCEPVDPVVRMSARCAAPDRRVVHGQSSRAIIPTWKSARVGFWRRAFAGVRAKVPESPNPRRGVVEGGALVCAPLQCTYRVNMPWYTGMRRHAWNADHQSHSAVITFPPGLKCV